MALSTKPRSKFAALHRQWGRLQMIEKFSNGTKNSNNQINQMYWHIHSSRFKLFTSSVFIYSFKNSIKNEGTFNILKKKDLHSEVFITSETLELYFLKMLLSALCVTLSMFLWILLIKKLQQGTIYSQYQLCQDHLVQFLQWAYFLLSGHVLSRSYILILMLFGCWKNRHWGFIKFDNAGQTRLKPSLTVGLDEYSKRFGYMLTNQSCDIVVSVVLYLYSKSVMFNF